MVDVDAGRVVAGMSNDTAFRNRAVMVFPHNPMHVLLAPTHRHLAVAVPITSALVFKTPGIRSNSPFQNPLIRRESIVPQRDPGVALDVLCGQTNDLARMTSSSALRLSNRGVAGGSISSSISKSKPSERTEATIAPA
jgi:hypothetical protein